MLKRISYKRKKEDAMKRTRSPEVSGFMKASTAATGIVAAALASSAAKPAKNEKCIKAATIMS